MTNTEFVTTVLYTTKFTQKPTVIWINQKDININTPEYLNFKHNKLFIYYNSTDGIS